MFGGSAGGGKSFGLLLEPLRHVHNPRFGTVIFRRTYPEIMGTGGLWDTAGEVYPQLGAVPNKSGKSWRFPSGATVVFRHLEHEGDVYAWQGAQIPLIGLDELTHFTARQVFYLMSRNRSTCGVRPYGRATCNPDAGSWVAEFLSWWIDQLTGFPVPGRAGVLRWFYRKGDDIHWFDSPRGRPGVARVGGAGPAEVGDVRPGEAHRQRRARVEGPGVHGEPAQPCRGSSGPDSSTATGR